jgi:hypothetical protein
MNAHGDGFRPSHFPALATCSHHQNIGLGVDNAAALRGTGIHERIPQIIKATDSIDYSKEDPPVQVACRFVIHQIMEGWRVVGTEIPIAVLDGDGQEITHGTLDLLLERNREYQIVDWKSGDKNGYAPQVAGYISAVLDLYPKAKRVYGTIVYLDLEETETIKLSSQECYGLVQNLWDKWRNKEYEPYTINPYCNYCARRGECPAWREQAETALDTVAQLGIPTGSALVTAKVDALKNDPAKLEEFILAWERAQTLVTDWKLKDALKTHMETGFKADHHILVHVKNSASITRSIDPEQFLEKIARHIGNMRAASAIKVDPDKAVAAWGEFYGYEPESARFPVAIDETTVDKPGYSYIRAKGRAGAGDARKKRNELG